MQRTGHALRATRVVKLKRTMWSSSATLLALLLVFVRPALGDPCVLTVGSLYQLKSDAVDWTMQTSSGQSCIRGLRHKRVTIDTAKLVSPPQSGQVKLLGPGFSYTAKSDFQGQDSFTIQVSGMLNGIRGSSDIRIIVSVGSKSPSSPSTPKPSPSLATPPAATTQVQPPGGGGALPAFAASVFLTWNASTDDPGRSGVAGYRIYRNGVLIGTSTTTDYTDNTASPGIQYTYTVSAFDVAGNESGQSVPAIITTNVEFVPLHKYYIAASGCSDGNAGTSPASPWCTPNHAVVCGDVIIAAAGTYSTGQFNGGWGNVTNCPSTTGGIDGTGGIYFAVLLCGGADLAACQVTGGSPVFGFNSGAHNWAVEGFLVPNVSGSRAFEIRIVNGACNVPYTSHHIASINNIVYNSAGAFVVNDCGQFQGANPPAADYLAVVGTIAQNAAQDQICLGAIDFVGPGASDGATSAIKGFMYGNFAWNNMAANCNSLYDEEGLMFDTMETHSSNGIWVVQNNVSWYNGRYGFQLFYQCASSTVATINILNNTFFA